MEEKHSIILKTVFVRFYKSFNYDYLKKAEAKANKHPWEMIGDTWFPYVKIPIDSKVTTIVGANESGKSHLLSAIEKGITGENIKREDFCRYSEFFTVDKNELKWSDFGFEWCNLSEYEKDVVRASCDLPTNLDFDSFLVFRTEKEKLSVYLPNDETQYSVKNSKEFNKIIPNIFTIDSDIALPDSVSIKGLATGFKEEKSLLQKMRRSERFNMVESLSPILDILPFFESVEDIQKNAGKIHKSYTPVLKKIQSNLSVADILNRKHEENKLAYDLICKIGNVDPESLNDLYEALKNEKEGHANGIIQKINDNLAKNLNFPKWWVQDRNFRLLVSPREFDLVFTIRDRTETEYSFNERSSGLKYFLSYYVQYRAHEPLDNRLEILTMDEPDTKLSSQAQQDLLKIFEAFASPENGKAPIQVVYVTHSPFLIDKNHAERIRVLEKGVEDEGTRVVKDAAKNHYEPLRSAFGAFVGETAFIGNCNLMVEGLADQILLAGAASYLRRKTTASNELSKLETLDLNYITIVPAGSASHIPYMVYLARGRDVEQPAVIVLLDSDTAGNDAKKGLQRGGAYNKQLLKKEFIVQVKDFIQEADITILPEIKLIEIEDFIPVPICIEAAKKYAEEICKISKKEINKISVESVVKFLTGENSVFDAVKDLFETIEENPHIEKVGFARYVIDCVILESSKIDSSLKKSIKEFDKNFKALFRKLNKTKREAERELTGEKLTQKIERIRKAFLQDHPNNAKKEDAMLRLEEMEASLDESAESNQVKFSINELKIKFDLENDITQLITPYNEFINELNAIKYAGKLASQIN